ncbi:MAG: hydrogenase expression/formation protein HypE [Gemmataceae bacterium]|nr:hydrogenase expression/formation protein HypE [Gemmataceae bacterium]
MSQLPIECPVEYANSDVVLLAHGEGARATRRLIQSVILPYFANDRIAPLGDSAVLPSVDGRLAITTDGFVVTPLNFPGGDIGRLAVCGTVNDLVVAGADPLYLTLGLILEEGLPLATLHCILASVRDAAREADVLVVAGDTKVVPRGAADGAFITSAGIGRIRTDLDLSPDNVRPGDAVIVSGTLGDHGITVLAEREGFQFQGALQSDCGSIRPIVLRMIEAGVSPRWMRDPTRGGLASVLHELAETARLTLEVDESALPVSPVVRGACELLGLDPIYVANEGKLVALVPGEQADATVAAMRRDALGREARVVGRVMARGTPGVIMRTALGSRRVLDEPQGSPLPRIC